MDEFQHLRTEMKMLHHRRRGRAFLLTAETVIRKIRENDHYEVSLQNSRVPNSTVSKESIPLMIPGAREEKGRIQSQESQESRERSKSSWDFLEGKNLHLNNTNV